jgi:hypothetical protein
MKIRPAILLLLLSLTYPITGLSQSIVQKTKRLVTINLNDGKSITCNFIKADSDTIEVEVANNQLKIKLDEIANIVFKTQTSSASNTPASSATLSPTTSSNNNAPLLLLSLVYETSDRFIFLKGDVKNVSSKPLRNVTPIGIFRTRKGKVIKADRSLIPSILPGQTVPFNIVTYLEPNVEDYDISFSFFRGNIIPHQDVTEQQ